MAAAESRDAACLRPLASSRPPFCRPPDSPLVSPAELPREYYSFLSETSLLFFVVSKHPTRSRVSYHPSRSLVTTSFFPPSTPSHHPTALAYNMPPNPLSLKQRLAALSANINSPRSSSFDMTPDSPMSAKRKSFFKQPFGKASTSDHAPTDYHGQERVQEVMNRLIFQAGVDYECVPLYDRMPCTRLMGPILFAGHDRCMSLAFRSITQVRTLRYRIVMCASAMPDPREVSYDLLLVCVLFILCDEGHSNVPTVAYCHILTYMVSLMLYVCFSILCHRPSG